MMQNVWGDTACTNAQGLTGFRKLCTPSSWETHSSTLCDSNPPGPAPLLKAQQQVLAECSYLKLLLWACVHCQLTRLPTWACPAFQACPPTSGSKLSFCALQTAARATHLGLHHPPDRNGKAIMDKFSTPDLDEALNVYRIACDEARAAVRRQLRQLAMVLQVYAVLRWPVLEYTSWSDCSHVRLHMSRDRAVLANAPARSSAPAVMSAPPFRSSPECDMAIVAIGQLVLSQPSADAMPRLLHAFTER